MKDVVFSHFYPFESVPDALLPAVFTEFRDNGVDNLVFTDWFCKRLLKEHSFFSVLKRHCYNIGVKLLEMHAPFGESFDLACGSPARRPGMVQDHITCMRYAAEIGCRTYTIHIGAFDSVYLDLPTEQVRPRALSALEQIVPEAEKLGIVIAVENAFERCNTPDEVMYYVNAVNSPAVGCCFDSGHANVMAPGKQQAQYGAHMHRVWQGDVVFYPQAFEKMAPAMVTCHLHDNDGFSDQHMIPGSGTIDWQELTEKLLTRTPRLLSIQSEVNAASTGTSIRQLSGKFRELLPGLA